MSHELVSWEERYARIQELSNRANVTEAIDDALHSASRILQSDENAAATLAAHACSLRIVKPDEDGEQLGRLLDISLAIFWSLPRGSSETNALRLRAWSSLREIAQASLCDSSRDFISLTCLESNREGTVELVRCRYDKHIYVLKSTTKGAAKRGHRSNAPMTERRLLSLARDATKGVSSFTPSCIASFQSAASLHVLMEYCPAGDLYHFLESAGQAPTLNEARNPSGGLLSERYMRSYAIDVVAAISWLHAQGFMHRDIKPGNWLFDRSGHLLLCDLASAAPFALFDEVPANASLPRRSGARTSLSSQRRVLYRHCCLIGTADYIAPEIFWTADLMSRRKERQYDSYMNADPSATLLTDDHSDTEIEDDDDEPPPEGPGLYGPECDWWSVGVMMYEMVYKRLPFFSEKIVDTMEMIKNHEQHFHHDYRVECSDDLRDLLARLICSAEVRIGTASSEEVQAHPFFRGVDWSRPWRTSAPFVPQLADSFVNSDTSLPQPELSVLHSPRAGSGNELSSYDAGPGNWSKMWDGKADEFPGFPNSVELSRAVHESEKSQIEVTDYRSKGTNVPTFEDEDQSLVEQWSGFDPTWIGFSYVPSQDVFRSNIDLQPSSTSSLVAHDHTSAPDEPTLAELLSSSTPMASTPPQVSRHGTSAKDILRSTLKPHASLHRHAMQTATRLRASSAGDAIDGRFVTPMRKPSYSNVNLSGALTMADGAEAAIPPSPYPFPVATAIRPRKTPMIGTNLRRADLERARSASTSTGGGSDSRCSGGSNAKREISEREAWHELKIAVLQSARKGKWNGVEAEGDDGELEQRQERSMGTSGVADESHVPPRARNRLQQRDASDSRKTVSFHADPVASKSNARRPSIARLLSDDFVRKPLEPILDTTPPHASDPVSNSSTSSSCASSPSVSPQTVRVGEPPDRITVTPGTRPELGKRKSARQLLLKAQHRDTPTRIARTASPMLIEPLPEGGKASETIVAHIPPTGQDSRRTASADENGAPRAFGRRMSHNEALLPSAVANLKKMNVRLMRRRDSHETLSQYRQGIIPEDESMMKRNGSHEAGMVLKQTGHYSRPGNLALAATSAAKVERPLSSPSLPSFPDAFTEMRDEKNMQSLAKVRSHSTMPRSVKLGEGYGGSSSKSATLPRLRSAVPLGHCDANTMHQSDEQNVQSTRNASQDTRKTDDGPHQALFVSEQRPVTETKGKRPSLVKRASSYLSGKVSTSVENGAQRHTLYKDKDEEEDRKTSNGGPSRSDPTFVEDEIAPPNDKGQPSVYLGSLAFRYDRLEAHIHHVEGHLERLKARLQSDL